MKLRIPSHTYLYLLAFFTFAFVNASSIVQGEGNSPSRRPVAKGFRVKETELKNPHQPNPASSSSSSSVLASTSPRPHHGASEFPSMKERVDEFTKLQNEKERLEEALRELEREQKKLIESITKLKEENTEQLRRINESGVLIRKLRKSKYYFKRRKESRELFGERGSKIFHTFCHIFACQSKITVCGQIKDHILGPNIHECQINGKPSSSIVVRWVKASESKVKLGGGTYRRMEITLNHPHLWHSCHLVVNGNEQTMNYFYFYQLYEGACTLTNYIKAKPELFEGEEGQRRILAIAVRLLDALEYLKVLRVMHLRLSPDNIVIVENTSSRTIDVFIIGLDKLTNFSFPVSVAQWNHGGRLYAPPERNRDSGYCLKYDPSFPGHSDDIYPLGLIILFMLEGGKHFFEGFDQWSKLEEKVTSYLQSLTCPTLKFIVSKCLMLNINERWGADKILKHLSTELGCNILKLLYDDPITMS